MARHPGLTHPEAGGHVGWKEAHIPQRRGTNECGQGLAWGTEPPLWPKGIQQHVQSLLHYTFSKPETTFNFIKKLVKNNLAAGPCFLCIFSSPRHLSVSTPGLS